MDTQTEYVEENCGTQCPKCHSDEVRGKEFDLETNNRDCNCDDCGYKWTEIYRLSGYEPLGGQDNG